MYHIHFISKLSKDIKYIGGKLTTEEPPLELILNLNLHDL